VKFKSLLDGGVAGETYGQGVRRRTKSIAIIWGLLLVSLLVTYGAYALSGSVWVTLVAATICGVVGSRADLGFDPPRGAAPNRSDKLVWMMLFAPALLLLGGVSIYLAMHAQRGFDVFRAALVAGLFGWAMGMTIIVLLSADSRAHA
jgi:flagellar basal body-associated protein FliL